MRWLFYLIPVWFALALLIPISWTFAQVWRRFRGQLPVTCPDTNEPVLVGVSVGHAAASIMTGNPIRRLRECARWPDRADCGRECLRQLH